MSTKLKESRIDSSTTGTPKQSNSLQLIPADNKSNGNGSEAVLRLRLLISDLIDEVDSLDQNPLLTSGVQLPENGDSINFYTEVERFEVALIKSALLRAKGHQKRAARLLGLKPSTLNAKIKQYEIRRTFRQ